MPYKLIQIPKTWNSLFQNPISPFLTTTYQLQQVTQLFGKHPKERLIGERLFVPLQIALDLHVQVARAFVGGHVILEAEDGGLGKIHHQTGKSC